MPNNSAGLHRRRTGVSLTLAAAVLSALALAACKPRHQADPRLAERLVVVAIAQPAGETNNAYTGVVVARVQSDLGFRVAGKVTERLVDTGETVKLGQQLMRIDATDFAHSVAVQQGNVAAAEARWVQAATDEKRYRGLVATGAVASVTYDEAKQAADSARALLDSARAQQKITRNQGDYAVLLADADGTVVETLAEPGQVVTAGQTVVRLAHAGPREAAVDLPETVRPALGSTARATLYGGAPPIAARLRQLSGAADPRSRTYEARYVLDGAGAAAPLGATVSLNLADAGAPQAVQVPIGAIDDEGSGPGVWLIHDNRTVTWHAVRLERFGGETALLSGGVAPGARIVAVGGHQLHQGERVQLAGTKAAMQ